MIGCGTTVNACGGAFRLAAEIRFKEVLESVTMETGELVSIGTPLQARSDLCAPERQSKSLISACSHEK